MPSNVLQKTLRLPNTAASGVPYQLTHYGVVHASFRECDIRGRYPEEVTEEIFYAIGIAIRQRWKEGPVVIGHDVRHGSASLQSALIEGIVRSGGHAIDLGCVPTPVTYFARRHYRAPVGLMVTASHNPPEYNGLKLLLPDGPANQDDILWLRDHLSLSLQNSDAGHRESVDIWAQYMKALDGFWSQWIEPECGITMPRVVIDPGGGAWSQNARLIFNRLGIPCTTINDEPDGAFRARSPDCAQPASLFQLGCAVREHRAVAGLAWDGDGDRLAVVDSEGLPLSADQMGLIFAGSMPVDHQRILLDVKVSRKVSAEIKGLGGVPIIEKSAHCALERTMIEQDCLFGCEYSGHYFFRDLDGADDGLYAALRFLCILQRHQTLDSLLRQLPTFHVTSDIRANITPNEFSVIQSEILGSGLFNHAGVSRLDGLKLSFPEGWLLLRPSVSEDKLSFRAEGETQEDLAGIVRLFLSALPAKYTEMRVGLKPWTNSDPPASW